MTLTEIQSLLRRHVEAENANDLAATLSTLHPDCVFEDVALGKVFRGHAGAAEYYRMWWDAFRLQFKSGEEGRSHFTSEGNYVAEGRYHGKHVGSFLGVPATGLDVDFRFTVFVNFRDGLMGGERFYYDLGALWKQLGAPAPH